MTEQPAEGSFVDPEQTACLCDVGAPDYLAVTAVGADGTTHLALAHRDAIDDPEVTYYSTCPDAVHEQLGPLPLEFVRRLTVSRRTHRCGRRTQTGRPCRNAVAAPGDTCNWHRQETRA